MQVYLDSEVQVVTVVRQTAAPEVAAEQHLKLKIMEFH